MDWYYGLIVGVLVGVPLGWLTGYRLLKWMCNWPEEYSEPKRQSRFATPHGRTGPTPHS
jgi:hypothetical protein